MTLNLDYIFSTSLSVVMHGAIAAGLYGALVSGPQIDFSSGNNGIDVSIISPAELRGMTSNGTPAAVPQQAQFQPSVRQAQAEISLKRMTVRTSPQDVSKTAALKSSAPTAQKTASTQVADTIPSQNDATKPCATIAECQMHASLGRSGDRGVSNISLIQAPKPPYPWAARRAGFEGKVVVAVEVTKDGSVRAAQLAKSSGREDCDQSAIETIRERWRFEPARLNGQAIDWREKIVVVYDLRD